MKLLNTSKRAIHTKEGSLLPGNQLWEVSDALGAKLKRLYPSHIVDPTAPSAPMNSPSKKPEAATGVIPPAKAAAPVIEKTASVADKARAAQQARLNELIAKKDCSKEELKEMEALESALAA